MASANLAAKNAPVYQPRSYQLEMFEASMKENIIVAMDTGSGKTNIALLRIMGELESGRPGKLIWFLAPTVALCGQQHKVITDNIPAVRARTLTGLDKVELWTDQIIWDAVLKDIQVVVSTHAVLADAMTHGFVKISQLGLVIFDEAHHCMRRHPANKIMQEFYHPTLARFGRDAVPRIMGLTASPVVRSSQIDLHTIESNLDSICKTPRVHRQELLKYSHRPKLQQIWYTPLDIEEIHGTKTLNALEFAWETLDINDDPYVMELRQAPHRQDALQRTLLSRKTYCNEQIKKLLDRSVLLFHELGGWAADHYIHASKEQVLSKIYESSMTMDWADEEKDYLIKFFNRLPEPDISLGNFRLSPKMNSLIEFLDSMDDPEFSGIIFVKQRVTVSVMEKLLSVHPVTKSRFRCAAYVGWSNGNTRKEIIGELLTLKSQQSTLDEFRDGRKNLIIATDVLEEGIDISACRAVVCYDKPPNLKSFVQRRGRARQKKSVYAIMFSRVDESEDMCKWQILEKAMIDAYQDDERCLQDARSRESIDEDVEGRLVVESTGAVMTPDVACAHLNHFCSVLPREAYTDNAPKFSFESNELGKLKGKVILPSCVHPAIRQVSGESWWDSERAAVKETSFQAYKALYKFGLISDNLLPLNKKPEHTLFHMDDVPAVVEVSEQYDPWAHWASSWSSPDIHQTRIAVRLQGDGDYEMYMNLTAPVALPPLLPLTLYWDSETTFTVSFETPNRMAVLPADVVKKLRDVTAVYLQATSKDLGPSRDFVALFGPDLPHDKLDKWLDENQGNEAALEAFNRNSNSGPLGVIRDVARYGDLFMFKRWIPSEQDPGMVELECEAFPRRRNFLHRQILAVNKQSDRDDVEEQEPSSKLCIISAQTSVIDKLPFADAVFGLFISGILDRLEVTMIATSLCETILHNLGFKGMNHIITAITAPSAQALTNYQRYEFLGDSVLKYIVTCRLYYEYPNWHEGYLSERRNSIVQNARLTKAALDLGLDSFIITKHFTPRRWTAPLISEKITHVAAQRSMSSKVLADVVEALIGAAFIEGGYFQAEACIHRFLEEVPPPNPSSNSQTPNINTPHHHPENFRYLMDNPLQEQIGHRFNEASLLFEALTHPSCQHDSFTQSYQRLEFLGDAVLDMLVVPKIFHHASENFTPGDMTRIKHAVVNAHLLAFLCMEFAVDRESMDAVHSPSSGAITLQTTKAPVELWRFMRCGGSEMKLARDRTLARYRVLRDAIISNLLFGSHYPWELLARMNADKFFSDVIESIIGAIFVDSDGDLDACERFLERIGLVAYLRRLLHDGVVVMHPKNLALQMANGETKFNVQRVQAQGGEDASYRCVVTLDGVDIVVVEGCLSAEEAEVRAANIAIKRFKGESGGNIGATW